MINVMKCNDNKLCEMIWDKTIKVVVFIQKLLGF